MVVNALQLHSFVAISAKNRSFRGCWTLSHPYRTEVSLISLTPPRLPYQGHMGEAMSGQRLKSLPKLTWNDPQEHRDCDWSLFYHPKLASLMVTRAQPSETRAADSQISFQSSLCVYIHRRLLPQAPSNIHKLGTPDRIFTLPGVLALIKVGWRCTFGKLWRMYVRDALGVSPKSTAASGGEAFLYSI